MKRLKLAALRQDREELLKALQRLGCVEVSETAPPGGEEELPVRRADPREMSALRERETALNSALSTLKRYAPEKKALLSPAPAVTERELFDDAACAAALDTAKTLAQAEEKLAAARAEQGRLRERRAALEPWKDLDVPLDTQSTRCVDVTFAAVNAAASWEVAEAEAWAASEGLAELTKAGRDKDRQYFLLLCHNSAQEAVEQSLKPYGFTKVTTRGWTGLAADRLRETDARLAELDAETAKTVADVASLAPERDKLRLALDRTRQELRREESKQRLLDTDAAYLLEGWFPAADEEKVTALLGQFTAAWEISDPTEEELPQVPVKLKNGPLTRCMNTITEMYSLPAYDGIDPNPLMFPFFVVFFGMMMADMAYGILMMLGTQVVLRKMKPKESMRNFLELFFWCGVSTFIWGAMTGGFFGDFIPQLLRIMDPASTFEMPALFTPLNDTIPILLGSLVLGAIQVFTGMLISVIRKVQAGDFIDALFNEITWWIILAGTALAILGVGPGKLVLIAGALMLAIGGTRNAKGFGKVTSLVGLVYNGISGFFSDILSYLRLMALMLAGSVISQVFNTLGSVFGSVIPFVIISLIGNALNLALNLLGCYVHDLRLQCLEYFGRFYKEGGKPFKPLDLDTQYVNILKEDA